MLVLLGYYETCSLINLIQKKYLNLLLNSEEIRSILEEINFLFP